MFYSGAVIADPNSESKKDCEENAEGAAVAMGDIPLTFDEYSTWVDHEGNQIVTSNGDTILFREKVSFSVNERQLKEEIHLQSLKDRKVDSRNV